MRLERLLRWGLTASNYTFVYIHSIFAATAGISVLLASLLAFAAIRKLSHRPAVVESYLRAGVPEDRLDQLAVILLAGAAGLLVGLAWAPIGIAAAASLVAYFLVAIAFHLRADDAEHMPTPLLMAVLAAVTLALRVATL